MKIKICDIYALTDPCDKGSFIIFNKSVEKIHHLELTKDQYKKIKKMYDKHKEKYNSLLLENLEYNDLHAEIMKLNATSIVEI